MKYFLAIIPPSGITQQIEEFRAPWGPAKTPPHITVKAPNSLEDLSRWLPQVEKLCRQVAPFDVTLAGIGQFGATALYLRVVSSELVKLHHALLGITKPTQAERAEYFEDTAYLPHLTLAHAESGIPADAMLSIISLARERWRQPTRFVAKSLLVYKSVGDGNPYLLHQIIPFTGQPRSS